MLFMFLGVIVMVVINNLIFGPEIQYTYKADANGNPIGDPTGYTKLYSDGWFGDIFFLICFVPWLAVSWRRMHDIGKPGYLPFAIWLGPITVIIVIVLVNLGLDETTRQISATGSAHADVSGTQILIAFVSIALCFVLNIIWLARRSEPGSNEYGPNPNEVPQ